MTAPGCKSIELEPRNAELVGMVGHPVCRRFADRRKPARVLFRPPPLGRAESDSRICLAVLLEKGHRLDEARAAVAECLAIDPRDEQARYFSAVLDRRQGKIAEAEKWIARFDRFRASASIRPLLPARYELAQILKTAFRSFR